jgi:hypothetical protein
MAVNNRKETEGGGEFFVHEPSGDPTGRVYVRYSDVAAICVEKAGNEFNYPYKANILLHGGHKLILRNVSIDGILRDCDAITAGKRVD